MLKGLDGGAWKARIAEPQQRGLPRWRRDEAARVAVYANRDATLRRDRRAIVRPHSEAWRHAADALRGRETVHKRYLIPSPATTSVS